MKRSGLTSGLLSGLIFFALTTGFFVVGVFFTSYSFKYSFLRIIPGIPFAWAEALFVVFALFFAFISSDKKERLTAISVGAILIVLFVLIFSMVFSPWKSISL